MKMNLNEFVKQLKELNEEVIFEVKGNNINTNAKLDSIKLPKDVQLINNMLIKDNYRFANILYKESINDVSNESGELVKEQENGSENVEKEGFFKKARRIIKRGFSKCLFIGSKFIEFFHKKSKNSDEFEKFVKDEKQEIKEEKKENNNSTTLKDEKDVDLKQYEDITRKIADEETKKAMENNESEKEVSSDSKKEYDKLVKSMNEINEDAKKEVISSEVKNSDEEQEVTPVKETQKSTKSKKSTNKTTNYSFKSISQVKSNLDKLDKHENRKIELEGKIKEIESKIKYYKTFISTHDLSHKDDAALLNNMKTKLSTLEDSLKSLKEQLKTIEEKMISNESHEDDVKLRYYTQVSSKIDEKIADLKKDVPVWNKETFKYENDHYDEIQELKKLREDLLSRKQVIVSKYDEKAKTMSEVWYSTARAEGIIPEVVEVKKANRRRKR